MGDYTLLLLLLSCVSYVWLRPTIWTVACQAPLSMGFSGQEYWCRLPCPPSSREFSWHKDRTLVSWIEGRVFTVSHQGSLWLYFNDKWKLLSHVWLFVTPWNSPGKNTGVGSHALLQGLFQTQGSNPGCRDQTQIAGRFLTFWATRLYGSKQCSSRNYAW